MLFQRPSKDYIVWRPSGFVLENVAITVGDRWTCLRLERKGRVGKAKKIDTEVK